MTADLVAPHTPLHKGEEMYTSSLDAAAFPPASRWPRSRRSTPVPAPARDDRRHPLADLSQLAYVNVVLWEPAA